MSGRALIAIGCDAYDHIGPLSGAEADARDIFSTLMRPEVGDYDVERSRLLQSPTLQKVRDALATVLFDGGPLDTLALSFAGHGAVGAGSFYMALRDTKGQALSATALSLADLLRMVAEAAPKQTYLFIDACQSGGLISDLNVILKSEVMGELGTPGVTLVATAAANQSAYEVGGHGIGTTALLDCVRGDVFLQDTTPALDLVEIGRAVSERVAAVGDVVAAIAGYEFALINGDLGELYRLPLRLSKLLGWAAFAVHARRIAGEDGSSAAKRLDDLYSRIFATYSLSLVSMSDCQAPDVLIALTASSHAGLMDYGERLLSHMFSSAVLCNGRVARSDLDPSKQLSYLIARTGSGTEPNLELVAQPTELVLVLLRASRLGAENDRQPIEW